MNPFPCHRPPVAERCFVSTSVENTIRAVCENIADPELAWLFRNCYPNTLDTTVRMGKNAEGETDTFIITGDIPAMWLRDSTNQVWPYLPLAGEDADLRNMLEGLIRRQTASVLLDPYANAFLEHPEDLSEWASDETEMRPGVHERKFEVDSLCAFLRLSAAFYAQCPDSPAFNERWQQAVRLVVKTFRVEQKPGNSPYQFSRPNCNRVTENLQDGIGFPFKPCGLVRSPFRPSDDATVFPFLIPANAMAVVNLRAVAEMHQIAKWAEDLRGLADEIDAGIQSKGRIQNPDHGEIYAYEVDGYGSAWLMDDANLPSLLSLPYLGYCPQEDPVYLNTRRFLWSEHNPYFVSGAGGYGIGGPHKGPDWPWPMSMMVRALTTDKDEEIRECLQQLKATHAGSGFMHETFHKEDANRFTREWFAWANSLFGELILKLVKEKPELLKSPV
jgi:meiotically up-regulated gene 157 (Mug157) protein